jgi:hypothetical protein
MVVVLVSAFLLVSCEKASDVTIDDIIVGLSCIDCQSLRADGISQAIIVAKIPAEAVKKTISFKASSGSFYGTNGAASIDVIAFAGEARAIFIAGRAAQTIVISAAIAGYQKNLEINLQRAFADRIIGESSTLLVKTDGSQKAELKAILSRNAGKVSIGTPVIFRALQMDTQGNPVQVGRFLGIDNSKTDESGIAKITFIADTGNVIIGETITIEMETEMDNGSKLLYKLYLNAI